MVRRPVGQSVVLIETGPRRLTPHSRAGTLITLPGSGHKSTFVLVLGTEFNFKDVTFCFSFSRPLPSPGLSLASGSVLFSICLVNLRFRETTTNCKQCWRCCRLSVNARHLRPVISAPPQLHPVISVPSRLCSSGDRGPSLNGVPYVALTAWG